MSACSELLTFRLSLLLLLGIILGYCLTFLEWVADVLCRLVGQTVIVDSLLSSGLLRDLDPRVVETGVRSLLVGIEFEIDGAWLTLLVDHILHLHDFPLTYASCCWGVGGTPAHFVIGLILPSFVSHEDCCCVCV